MFVHIRLRPSVHPCLREKLAIYADHKVAVISIAGAFRTGKSFLLNYLLLYLRKLEAESNADWLTDDHEKLTGFTWRRGAGKPSS